MQDATRVQAGVVGNIDGSPAAWLRWSAPARTRPVRFRRLEAGNQLFALQSQQLSDLIAMMAANGRATALTEAERATAAEQGRIQRVPFLTPGAGYQPGNARMFNNGNN